MLDVRGTKIPVAAKRYLGNDVETFHDVREFVEEKLAEFEFWVKNPSLSRPMMFNFKSVFKSLISAVSPSDPRLEGCFFRVFVGEFENLQGAQ